MSFREKNKTGSKSQIKKFSAFAGSWDEYLDYLNDFGVVSMNLQRDNLGHWHLRDGYYPEWTLKDFK